MNKKILPLVTIVLFSVLISVNAQGGGNNTNTNNNGGRNRGNQTSTTQRGNNSNSITSVIRHENNSHLRVSERSGNTNGRYDQITLFISNTDKVEQLFKMMNREVKKGKKTEAVKSLDEVKKILSSLESGYRAFYEGINESERSFISDQNLKILRISKEIRNNIDWLSGADITSGSNMSLHLKNLEKQINNLNRQYRAIRWILYESS